MTDREKVAFRAKLIHYLTSIVDADPEKNMKLLCDLENWIARYVDIKVSQAIKPFLKIQNHEHNRKN